jgi:hypothetical protein
MRHFVVLLSLILVQDRPIHAYGPLYISGASSLQPFTVIHHAGCEVVLKSVVQVRQENGLFIAVSVAPQTKDNDQKDSVWAVVLDDEKIATCLAFLNKARSLPSECPVLSTSISRYTVIQGEDTVHIHGECDWEGLDFSSLRAILFREKIEAHETRRTTILDSLNTALQGRWYYFLARKPERGERVILVRRNDPSQCYWEFSMESKFSNSCNEVFDFKRSETYRLNLQKQISLVVAPGAVVSSNGTMSISNYGGTFILDSVTDSLLSLTFLWD